MNRLVTRVGARSAPTRPTEVGVGGGTGSPVAHVTPGDALTAKNSPKNAECRQGWVWHGACLERGHDASSLPPSACSAPLLDGLRL